MKKIICFTISVFIFSGCIRDKCPCRDNEIPFDSKKWKKNCGEIRQYMRGDLIQKLENNKYTKQEVIELLGNEDSYYSYCPNDTTLHYYCFLDNIGVSDREHLIIVFKNNIVNKVCFLECHRNYYCRSFGLQDTTKNTKKK